MMKKRESTSFSRRSNDRSYPESSRPLVHLTQREKTAESKRVFSATSNPDASVSFAGASIFNLGMATTIVQSNSSISGKIQFGAAAGQGSSASANAAAFSFLASSHQSSNLAGALGTSPFAPAPTPPTPHDSSMDTG
jgi:hypothetical protein